MTDTDTIRDLRSRAALYPRLSVLSTDVLALLDEVRELRRILYAAIDPETGATSAQDVRDLIQGELNAIATTPKEVTDPGAVDEGRPAPGSLTSFGADDWATVEPIYADPYTRIAWLHGEIERLRAADQAKTEALREIASVSDARADDPLYTRDVARDALAIADVLDINDKYIRAALAAAAAAPKETP